MKLRAKTAEEVRAEFLDELRQLVQEWSEMDGISELDRCNGLVFSLLCLIDGATDMPGLDLCVGATEEDAQYWQEQGKNWYEPDQLINDCALHELWYQTK
jgi:hypothetical protein